MIPSSHSVDACSSISPQPDSPHLQVEQLVNQAREPERCFHSSIRTELAYVHWVVRYVRFNRHRHPDEMGHGEVGELLTWLCVAVNTGRQALSALPARYKQFLGRDLS